MSGGRKTALTLVLAILAFQLLAQGQVQAAWKAMWGTSVPLGKGMTGGTSTSSGTNNNNNNQGNGAPSGPPIADTTIAV